MNEYKFKYEAAPVSEIIKSKQIKAECITESLKLFHEQTEGKYEIISIELV